MGCNPMLKMARTLYSLLAKQTKKQNPLVASLEDSFLMMALTIEAIFINYTDISLERFFSSLIASFAILHKERFQ